MSIPVEVFETDIFENVVNIENSEVTVNDLQEFLKASQESKISLKCESNENNPKMNKYKQ